MPPRIGDEVTASLAQIVEVVLAADEGDDPKFAHRERVGIRRLRARLRTFRPVLRRSVVDDLDRRLRALGNRLGRIRDRDVLAARLERHGAELGIDVGWWTARLADEREAARRELRDARSARDHRRLRRDLEVLATDPPFRRSARLDRNYDRFLRRRLRDEAARFERLRAALGPDPDDAALHDFRKHIKRTRFVFETAAATCGGLVTDATSALSDLSDALGELQDTVVAEAWLAGHDPDRTSLRVEQGALLEHEAVVGATARDAIGPAIDAADAAIARAVT